jgi:hypothetical protein
VDTGAYVTVVRPDIATGWPERQLSQRFKLKTVSGETLPILKEVFLILTLGCRPLKIWVFVANITNELILGLDILHTYDASVDLGRQHCIWQAKRYRYGAQVPGPVLPAW